MIPGDSGSSHRASPGVTLTELMLSTALTAGIVTAFAGFQRGAVTASVRSRAAAEGSESARAALRSIERDLYGANQVTVASATLIEFVCDIDRSPDYDGSADADSDGVPNERDGDMDGDAQLIAPAAAQWRHGFNLKDDDEDGDGRVDMRVRYYVSGRSLARDVSINEEAWGRRVREAARGVSSLTFSYFGNKAAELGKLLDRGADGLAGTSDPGENDGVIDQAEMDRVAAPAGAGNRSGALDTDAERRYVTSVRISLAVDSNGDGRPDGRLLTEVQPPLLPLKGR